MNKDTERETNRDECALVLAKLNTLAFVNITNNQTIHGDMTFKEPLAVSDRFFIFQEDQKSIIGHFYFVKAVTGFMGFGQKYGIFSCEVRINKNKNEIKQIIQATEPIYTHNTPIQKLFIHENGGFFSSSNVSYKYFNPELDQSDNVETYSKKIRSAASLGQKMDRFFNVSSKFTYADLTKSTNLDKALPLNRIIKYYSNKRTFIYCNPDKKKCLYYDEAARSRELPLNDAEIDNFTKLDLQLLDPCIVDINIKNNPGKRMTPQKCFYEPLQSIFSLNFDPNTEKLLPVRHVTEGKLYFPVFNTKTMKIIIKEQTKNSVGSIMQDKEIALNEFIKNSDVEFQSAVRTPNSVLLLLYKPNEKQTGNHNLLLSVPVALLKPKTE
ncbi:hypothetical protein IPH67_01400 [bacterium]|nr:MAG: hypothetical protein IPH67_01400 [bacterium]